MKRNRRFRGMVIVLFALALAALGWVGLKDGKRTRRLADGSKVTLERVCFGTVEDFYPHNAWKEKLPEWLPKFARRLIGPNGRPTTWQKDAPELACWFTFTTDEEGMGGLGFLHSARLLDEHGCVFKSTSCNTDGDPEFGQVTGFFFASFPRRSDRFTVQVVNGETLLAEFEVTNPAKAEFPVWQPETLPASSEQSGFEVELRKLWFTGNESSGDDFSLDASASLSAEVSVSRAGKTLAGWRVVRIESEDATGNHGPDLCVHESAWKLQAELARPAAGEFAVPEVWRLGRFPVPQAGELNRLDLSNHLAGVVVLIQSIAGAGDYTYSNKVCIAAGPPTKSAGPGDGAEDLGLICGFGLGPRTCHVRQHGAHLILDFPSFSGAGHLATLRGNDDRGRPILHETRTSWSSLPIRADLGLSPDAKHVDLELVIHRTEWAEFLVQPPSPKGLPDNAPR